MDESYNGSYSKVDCQVGSSCIFRMSTSLVT